MPKNDDLAIETGLHSRRHQASAAIMDPGAIDEERGVIKGEERLRNSPAAIVGVKQLEILAAGTLLPQRMPIGDMDIIGTAPRERFVEFYRSEEHTSELQSLMRISYAVFCLKKKIKSI